MAPTLSYAFDVTIPAGTLKSAPLVTPVQFETNTVKSIQWVFPGGCNGVVGIQIGAQSVPILPSGSGQFYIRSGSTQGIDVEGMHNTGDWSIIGYNTGSFNHTIHVAFTVGRIVVPEPDLFLINDTAPYLRMGAS